MYDEYSLYRYNLYSGIIDYKVGIEVWSNPNSDIKLSEDNIAVALKNKTIKNGFTLVNFNNTGLKEQLIEIQIWCGCLNSCLYLLFSIGQKENRRILIMISMI